MDIVELGSFRVINRLDGQGDVDTDLKYEVVFRFRSRSKIKINGGACWKIEQRQVGWESGLHTIKLVTMNMVSL
jgi:hypothetical protein